MSHTSDDYAPPTGSPELPPAAGVEPLDAAASGSTADTATEQAQQVKDQAVDTTKQVAGVAAEQVQSVASEAKAQTRNLAGEARQQVTEQASTQQNNLASWLFSVVEELEQMVDRSASSGQGSQTSGTATTLVRQASERARGAATWLQDHEPQDLLAETGRFARRRPGLFLGLALAGGVVAGRLTRGLTADDESSASEGTPSEPSSTGAGAPAYDASYAASDRGATYGTGDAYLVEAVGPVDTIDTIDPLVDVDPVDELRLQDPRYSDDAGRL